MYNNSQNYSAGAINNLIILYKYYAFFDHPFFTAPD